MHVYLDCTSSPFPTEEFTIRGAITRKSNGQKKKRVKETAIVDARSSVFCVTVTMKVFFSLSRRDSLFFVSVNWRKKWAKTKNKNLMESKKSYDEPCFYSKKRNVWGLKKLCQTRLLKPSFLTMVKLKGIPASNHV